VTIPRDASDPLLRECPVLRAGAPVQDAVRRVLDANLPALPVADQDARLCGIFGEREFFSALFPGYLAELTSAGFVPRSLESALEKRAACRDEPVRAYMNTERVDVGTEFSDAQIAETFLHHRVLIIPVVDADRRILGVVTRSDFFRAAAERFVTAG
jgi:CBS-domain-containing membrane protein